MKQIISVIIIILPIILNGMNYSIGDTLKVVAFDGLTVRSTPSIEGDKVAILGTYEQVYIKDTFSLNGESESFFGFSGKWVLIQTMQNNTGYVFDAFLSTLPVANPISENKKSIQENSFEYSQRLTHALESYARDNFIETDCVLEYNNRFDGEMHHGMTIQKLQEGHVLINHSYWEGTSTELQFKNVRISEIFYLVHQFFKNTNEETLKIDDEILKNPKSWRVRSSCIGELTGNGCGVEVYKDSNNAFSVKFNFPCC